MKFRKKQIEIEAMRFDGNNAGEVISWIKMSVSPADVSMFVNRLMLTADRSEIIIPTLEGDMLASQGDWIIRGVAGEFYPCKPHIFDATYERVE